MKKMTKLLSAIFACALTASCLASCGSAIAPTASKGDKTGATNPIVLVNGYENERDLNSVMLYEFFGTGDLETAPEDETATSFVKSGEGSMKLVVKADEMGGVRKNYNPYLYQSCFNQARGIDCRDFSKTIGVAADFYNATEKAQRVGVRLVYSTTYHSVHNKAAIEWYTLQPGQWTTVHCNVIREKIPMTKLGRYEEEGNCPTTEFAAVRGVDYLFDRPLETEDDATYYMDNFRLFNTSTTTESVEKAVLPADTFADFNSIWQVQSLRMNVPNENFRASLTWSKAFSSDGGASLRVDMKKESSGYTYLQIQKSLYFPDLDLSEYGPNDRFCFEAYSPVGNGYSGSLGVWCINTGSYFYSFGQQISPGKMISYSIPVSEINASQYVDFDSFLCFEYMNIIQISWREPGADCVLYLDNFRMERAGE